MKERPSDLTKFSNLLGALKVSKTVKEHLKNHEIWSKWKEIVGTDLARVTSPITIKSKALEIAVAHQAWAHQLHFLTPSILNKIRTLCPQSQVGELLFKVAPIQAREEPPPPKKIPPKVVQLSERQEMTLRAVEDEDLRASIRKAMEASARRALS